MADERPTCSYYPGPTFASFITSSISLILIIFLTIVFVQGYFQSQSQNQGRAPISRRYFLLCIFTIISFINTHVTMSLTMVYCYFSVNSTSIRILSSIHSMSWLVAGLLLLYLFIVRLRKVFENTTFEFSGSTFFRLYISLFTITILGILSTFSLLFNTYIAFLFAIAGLFLYLILSIIILYLFVYGLFTVAVTVAGGINGRQSNYYYVRKVGSHSVNGSINGINTNSVLKQESMESSVMTATNQWPPGNNNFNISPNHMRNNSTSINSIKMGDNSNKSDKSDKATEKADKAKMMSKRQKQLIELMSKYVVLVSFSVLSTFIIVCIVCIRAYLLNNGFYEGNRITYFIHFNCIMLDTIINCVCLMMQFRFFGKTKYKLFCGYFHKKCKNIVQNQAIKHIEKQIEHSIAANNNKDNNNKDGNDHDDDDYVTPSNIHGGGGGDGDEHDHGDGDGSPEPIAPLNINMDIDFNGIPSKDATTKTTPYLSSRSTYDSHDGSSIDQNKYESDIFIKDPPSKVVV